jgi:hypothetical protein
MAITPLRRKPLTVQRPLTYGVNFASPQLRGLVGWWPLGRSVGLRNMVGPTSGGYTGAVAVNPLLGNCHDFDDNTDSSLITTYTAINDLLTLTLSVWYIERSSGGGTFARLVDKNVGGNGFYIRAEGTGTMVFEYRKWTLTAGTFSFPSPALDASGAVMPHHIAVSYDASAGTGAIPVVLIDGVPQTVTTLTAPTGTATDSEVSDLRIGDRSAVDRTWDGLVADVRIYNRAMTTGEMYALWNPATRWDLYHTVAQKMGSLVSGNAPAATAFPHHYYAQQRSA